MLTPMRVNETAELEIRYWRDTGSFAGFAGHVHRVHDEPVCRTLAALQGFTTTEDKVVIRRGDDATPFLDTTCWVCHGRLVDPPLELEQDETA